MVVFFFFQAEDGIRDHCVTGVQTCALPILTSGREIVVTRAIDAAEQRTSPVSRAELTGCPWHDTKAMLRQVGLRPTRQRMALGWMLFAKGGRHITAEMLYEEATRAKVPVSLATVYNTLHQFTEVG